MISLSWPQAWTWRLHNHSLLKRTPRSKMLHMVARICGLHAQMMSAADLQLWARVNDWKPDDFKETVWQERSLVKTWAMRGTLHLLPASDYGLYIAALSTRDSWRQSGWLRYFELTLPEMEGIVEAIGKALDGRCLTREELAKEVARITRVARHAELLGGGWGSFLKPAASAGLLCFGPSQGQSVTFVRPDQWIGPFEKMDPQLAVQELLRRFLTAYGPASRDDFAQWFGVAPTPKVVRPLFEALVGELEEVEVEGWKGYALASTIKKIQAASDTSTVRLLPNFDLFINLNYSHRHFMLDKAYTARVYRKSAWVSPVVMVNGRMEGVWSYEKKKGRTLVTVEMFSAAGKDAKAGIEEEAGRLGDFLGAPAEITYKLKG